MSGSKPNVDSLRKLAQQFTPARKEFRSADQNLALIAEKDDLEDYNEFPRLGKYKTYEIDDVKKPSKPIPERNTIIKCAKSEVVINLKDCELYESAGNNSLHPIFLKNSYAVFEGLESCELMKFIQDELGNYILTVEAKGESETVNLGCIVKFEFCRPEFSSLVISSREIDGDIAVIGAPCSIEFLVGNSSDNSNDDEVGIKRLNSTKNKILHQNKEAVNFQWNTG